jgi:UDP-N-acetyl-D-galactosamine dehydrogenase
MEVVARWIKPGCIIILESTVYPGCSEEVCIPLVERLSGLRLSREFHFCYSSERINPGDPVNNLRTVMKVVGGSDEQAREFAKTLYGQFVSAGVHSAGSLKAAEVSKLFENIQRDVNIALANELYSICYRLGIDFWDALEAASTKWNYARYTPGLVGGHCIGVDPYYLIHKAASVGVNASFITLAREINEGAVQSALNRIVKEINLFQCRSGVLVRNILFFGLTFKQDVADWRNSKHSELVKMLQSYGYTVKCVDSLISEAPEGVQTVTSLEGSTPYECVVFALHHKADEHLRAVIRSSAESRLLIDGLFP